MIQTAGKTNAIMREKANACQNEARASSSVEKAWKHLNIEAFKNSQTH